LVERARLVSELDRIAARIERIVLAPDQVKDALGWLAGPILRAVGWKAALSTSALSALLARPSPDTIRRAIDELEDNVSRTERACVVHARPPIGHATWLWRVLAIIHRATQEGADARALSNGDAILFLPRSLDAAASGLSRVDLLLELAREEPEMLGRRRALLEAARRALLDATSAERLPHAVAGPRAAYIARSIEEIDRLEAAGVDPRRGLLHQARSALRRNERDRLRACLVAVDSVARRRGDERLATIAARALDMYGGDPLAATAAARTASVHRTAEETFGAPLLARVREGITIGGEHARAIEREKTREKAARYFAKGAEEELLSAALAVDGWFDVGGASTPLRVVEEETRRQLVRHPAVELTVVPAQRVEDLRDAILTDPRAMLFQLAEGTLLARRYVVDETVRHVRSVLTTELRIYVADGSSSMLGPRARMRDAILLAELATLVARLRQPQRFLSPVLEMRFFDHTLGPITRASTIDAALAAIADIFATPRTGGTNIERALLESFDQVRARRVEDPALAGAQIVLVTDGQAHVDAAKVRQARASAGDVPIRLSIIALGKQNDALREIAAEQRALGERVFYHFVDDAELARIAAGDLEHRLVLHGSHDRAPNQELAALLDEMDGAVREERHERDARTRGKTTLALDEVRALAEAGAGLELDLETLFADGARARIELLERDERALIARFDRWFPARPSSARPDPIARTPAAEQVELARALVLSTLEVLDAMGARGPERRSESIAIFERLLFEHGLPPWTYATVLRDHGQLLAEDLRRVRDAVGA
jgi:hypothetical protein